MMQPPQRQRDHAACRAHNIRCLPLVRVLNCPALMSNVDAACVQCLFPTLESDYHRMPQVMVGQQTAPFQDHSGTTIGRKEILPMQISPGLIHCWDGADAGRCRTDFEPQFAFHTEHFAPSRPVSPLVVLRLLEVKRDRGGPHRNGRV